MRSELRVSLSAFLLIFSCALTPEGRLLAQQPTAQEIDQLAGPIALYPDAIVIHILTASKDYGAVLSFAGWLAWNGLRNAWAQLHAILTPPLTFEGTLEERTLVERSGVRVNYRVWMLKFTERTWEIYKRDVEHTSFSTRVTVGSQIRIQYRQGTNQITHLWTRPKK